MARKPERVEASEKRFGGQPENHLPASVKVFAENLLNARRAAKLTQVQLPRPVRGKSVPYQPARER